jgi:hypothetical protein
VVLALVDCSLVTPPQPGPDQRMRYSLLQTLRDYGRALGAEAGEETLAIAALAAFALPVAKQAAAGLDTSDDRELAALHWLDAEEARMAAALDWTLDHDPETALQLGVALAPWWITRGRAVHAARRRCCPRPGRRSLRGRRDSPRTHRDIQCRAGPRGASVGHQPWRDDADRGHDRDRLLRPRRCRCLDPRRSSREC